MICTARRAEIGKSSSLGDAGRMIRRWHGDAFTKELKHPVIAHVLTPSDGRWVLASGPQMDCIFTRPNQHGEACKMLC